jgi:hypothetical protein
MSCYPLEKKLQTRSQHRSRRMDQASTGYTLKLRQEIRQLTAFLETEHDLKFYKKNSGFMTYCF